MKLWGCDAIYIYMTRKNKLAQQAWANVRASQNLKKIADKLGITYQAVHQWDQIPDHRLVDVSRATGMTLQELRPDFFVKDMVA